MRQRSLLCASALLLLIQGRAQTELSVFSSTGRAAATTFVTDYQSLGINPANLGWAWRHEGKKFSFGLLEGTYSIYSDALTRDEMRNRMMDGNFRFTQAEKEKAGRDFANAGIIANVDLMLLGFSYYHERLGGFGFQVRDRVMCSTRFGPRMSQIAFEGYGSDYFDLLVLITGDTVSNYPNMSPDSLALVTLGLATDPQLLGSVMNDSHISSTWYREYNVSYGHYLVRNDDFELDAGVGLKYLVGIGIIDINVKNKEIQGFSALSEDLGIDQETLERDSDAKVNARNLSFPRAAGTGIGVDLGFSAILRKEWRFGAALTNLGSIKWTGNTYTVADGSFAELATAGLMNYNLLDGLDIFVSDDSLMRWEAGASRRVPLASTVRLGAGKLLGKKAEVGVDAVIPLNSEPGSLENPLVGLGGDYRPLRWLQLSAGLMVGGGYDTKLPVGVTFIAGNGTYEAGIASRDVITYFSEKDPTVSLSLGFLRFRF
ncbi:MAG TPA: DUF5723 family protein [Flavobacteriales bacterium]